MRLTLYMKDYFKQQPIVKLISHFKFFIEEKSLPIIYIKEKSL